MRIFLDANVLISVLNKEYPTSSHSARILSLGESSKKIKLFTSPMCLAIAFSFAEKKSNSTLAKQKIDILCQHISIAENTKEGILKTLQNKSIHDFEDGLEYYAAVKENCNCILTEDRNDFYFSEIEVLNYREFSTRYLASKEG